MILVSIGANLPAPDGAPPLETCRRAAAALDALPGLRLRGLSRWFMTAPVLPASAIRRGSAAGLRERRGAPGGGAWRHDRPGGVAAPSAWRWRRRRDGCAALPMRRVCWTWTSWRWMTWCVASPDPVLPHPRAHERAFVLVPLADVAPGWVHPVLGRSVEALIAGLPPQDVRAL